VTRYAFTLNGPADRERAARVLAKAPAGTRVEFKASKRSTDQNAMMWALLSDVAMQATHNGRQYTPDQWKVLFMHACGREVQFMPALDGSTFIPWGRSSSDLSKAEMGELLDFIMAWGAEHGVVFSGEKEAA